MTEVGLVDDAAYAQEWVRQRQQGRGLARRALADELRRKGVDDELAAEALATVDDETERAARFELAERKARASRGQPHDKRVRSLAGMLARKGYASGVAFGVVREGARRRGGRDRRHRAVDPSVLIIAGLAGYGDPSTAATDGSPSARIRRCSSQPLGGRHGSALALGCLQPQEGRSHLGCCSWSSSSAPRVPSVPTTTTSFTLPDTESKQVQDILEADFGNAGNDDITAKIVFSPTTGKVTDPAAKAEADEAARRGQEEPVGHQGRVPVRPAGRAGREAARR